MPSFNTAPAGAASNGTATETVHSGQTEGTPAFLPFQHMGQTGDGQGDAVAQRGQFLVEHPRLVAVAA
ncbi:hypothetical protein JCM17961_30270 [Endothiovibrio diazotrophicus]